MRSIILRIDRASTSLAMAVACLMLAVASLLGMYQIVTRFVLEQPAEWTEILIRVSLIWMVFMGIPTAFRQGAMVSVDVLYRWSPKGMTVIDNVDKAPFVKALTPVEGQFEKQFGKANLDAIRDYK